MRFLLLLFAAIAAHAQTRINILEIIPNPADSATGEFRLREKRANGTNYVGFKSPVAVGANVMWTLPAADSSGCFSSDGAGVITIAACSGSGSLPVSDTTAIVYGATDPTKQVFINVDTLVTSGTTRTLFVPDYSITLLGQDNTSYASAPVQYTQISSTHDGGSPTSTAASADGDLILSFVSLATDNGSGHTSRASLINSRIKTDSFGGGSTHYGGEMEFVTYKIGGGSNILLMDKDGNFGPEPAFGNAMSTGTSGTPWINAHSNTFWGYATNPLKLSRSGRTTSQNMEFCNGTCASGTGDWALGMGSGWADSSQSEYYLLPYGGANVPVFEVEESGNSRFTGNLTVTANTISNTFNALTGAGGSYKVGGTTVIDASRNGTFNNVTVAGTCTGCGGGGAGGGIPNSVVLSDYTAFSTCNGDIAAGFANAVNALDAIGGGTLIVPAGQWCSDSKLQITKNKITVQGVSGWGNAGAVASTARSASRLGWRTAPGSPTALIEFYHTKGGGLRDITLQGSPLVGFSGGYTNVNANTRLLRLVNSSYGLFYNFNGEWWTNGPGVECTTDTNALDEGCAHNTFIHMTLNYFRETDNVSGVLLDGEAGAVGSGSNCACSNIFIGGQITYAKDGSGTYGMKLKFADNNRVYGTFITASGTKATTNPVISFERTTLGGCRDSTTLAPVSCAAGGAVASFPQENTFQDVSLGIGNGVYAVQGQSGIGENIINLMGGDCGGALMSGGYRDCTPNVDYIRGTVNGRMYGNLNSPPSISWAASDTTQTAMLKLDQWSSSYTNGGSIGYYRQGVLSGKMDYDVNNGMGFYTTAPLSSMSKKWSILTNGGFVPSVDGAYGVGAGNAHLNVIYSQNYQGYISGAMSNNLQSDTKIDHFMDVFNSSASSNSPFIHFRRWRGSRTFPSPAATGDRLGGLAWFGGIGSGTSTVKARVEVDIDSGTDASEMRFAVTNPSNVMADKMTLKYNVLDANGIAATFGQVTALAGMTVVGTISTTAVNTTSLTATGAVFASAGYQTGSGTGLTTTVTVPCGTLSYSGGILISKGTCP